jgi:mannose-1-phosphate guanylyltransferase
MVLAAGLGTRLRPLTDLRAKPLVPVGDRPALAHVIDRLRAGGVERLVVNAHHRAEEVAAFARAQPGEVLVSVEHDLRGTAGGIAYAAPLLGEGDVLVWNADILATVDIGALTVAHAAGPAEATLAVQPLDAGQGSVGVDASGCIVRLRQTRFAPEDRGGQFLGVHILGASLRGGLPAHGGLIEDVYIPALARGAVLRAYRHAAPFFDVGTVEAYIDANVAWLASQGLGSWAGAGASVAPGVTLDRSIVGAGARVEGAGALVRCVVWPGARAVAPRQGAVITGA